MLEFNLTGNIKLNDGIKIAFIIDSNRLDRKMRLPKLLRTVLQSEKSTVRSQKFALRRSRKLTPANILKLEYARCFSTCTFGGKVELPRKFGGMDSCFFMAPSLFAYSATLEV